MLSQEIITYILGLAALVSIGVSVYNSLKKPQEKSAIQDAVFGVKLQDLEKTVINLRDNHIHTIECKLDKHISDQQASFESNIRQMTRIETLLETIMNK